MNAKIVKEETGSKNGTKICVIANGCHENFNDAVLLKQYMAEINDAVISDNYQEADLICLLGCANTKHMETESQELIEHIEATKRPGARLLIMGCLAKIRPDLGSHEDELNSSIGQMNPEALRFREIESSLSAHSLYCDTDPEIMDFKNARKEKIFTKNLTSDSAHFYQRISFPLYKVLFNSIKAYKDFLESRINVHNDKSYCIKICTGCLGSCSYCVIRFSRGKIKSKPIAKVMEEFRQGLDQGYRNFALIGTDLGDYGQDLGLDFTHLLAEMVAVPADFRLRLRNVNPRGIINSFPRFYELLKSKKIIYLLSPVQSGNNRILELMNRGYNIEDFMDCVQKIRAACPHVVLQTQFIVGFPTESEDEFLGTKAVVDQGVFDYVDVFRYSDRSGTKAASLYPKVPEEAIMQRYRTLFFKALFNRPIRKLQAIYRLN
jgi:tRNA A37 methylthiotransferase MiaB